MPDEAAVPIAKRIREHEEVWVAEEDGQPARLPRDRALDEPRRAPVLEKLYVEPAEQNRGIGSALLETRRRSFGRTSFYLWVFQKNDGARRLYERHGFELVKLTDGADNMEREPDALYRWSP